MATQKVRKFKNIVKVLTVSWCNWSFELRMGMLNGSSRRSNCTRSLLPMTAAVLMASSVLVFARYPGDQEKHRIRGVFCLIDVLCACVSYQVKYFRSVRRPWDNVKCQVYTERYFKSVTKKRES